ncbi:MAG: UDP-N-acetyl glucosamine 2-epimerase, partial [Candidatus Hermodarchaeota archaeon]
RIITDQLSDFLFTSEPSAQINLEKEGIDLDKIYFVGNIMIDNLLLNLDRAKKLDTFKKYNLNKEQYALITIHRPSNVDTRENLIKVIDILNYIQQKIKIFFPIHPRTRKRLSEFNLEDHLQKNNIILSEPVGYLEFLNLMMNSRLILTDSGGIQEEASYLKIPILTLRENTERPITIEKGTNEIVWNDLDKITKFVNQILEEKYKKGKVIEKWDGKTAKRIVDVLENKVIKY